MPEAPEHPISMSDFRVLALQNVKHVLAVSPETHEVLSYTLRTITLLSRHEITTPRNVEKKTSHRAWKSQTTKQILCKQM